MLATTGTATGKAGPPLYPPINDKSTNINLNCKNGFTEHNDSLI